jgi:peptide/nickel transport system permease protein
LSLPSAVQGSWIDQTPVSCVGRVFDAYFLAFGLMGLLIFYGILGWVGGPGRVGIFYDVVPSVTGLVLVDAVLV